MKINYYNPGHSPTLFMTCPFSQLLPYPTHPCCIPNTLAARYSHHSCCTPTPFCTPVHLCTCAHPFSKHMHALTAHGISSPSTTYPHLFYQHSQYKPTAPASHTASHACKTASFTTIALFYYPQPHLRPSDQLGLSHSSPPALNQGLTPFQISLLQP